MDSSLKFNQENVANIDDNEKRIPYRLCYKDRMKVTETWPVKEKIMSIRFHEQEGLESRKVLRLTKVNSVNAIQTNTIQDGNSIKLNRSISSVERRTTQSLYLPYLLVNKDAYITPVFNMASYKGFRTQEERKSLALSRSLDRDHKQLFHDGKDKCLAAPAVIDISKPAKLYSRYTMMQPSRSAR